MRAIRALGRSPRSFRGSACGQCRHEWRHSRPEVRSTSPVGCNRRMVLLLILGLLVPIICVAQANPDTHYNLGLALKRKGDARAAAKGFPGAVGFIPQGGGR